MKCPDCKQELEGDSIGSFLGAFWSHDCPVSIEEAERRAAKVMESPEAKTIAEESEGENMALKRVTTFEAVQCDACKKEAASMLVDGTTRLPEGWVYIEVFRKAMHLCTDCATKPASEMVEIALGKKP